MGNIFEDNSLNPFSDPEFRKEFLKDKGLLKDDKSDSGGAADYEVIPPSDITIGKETGKVINPIDVINRSSKIPNSVGTIMHDLSGGKNMGALEKSQKSAEIKSALGQVLQSYNEKFGLNVTIDLDNTANMLACLADEDNFKAYELYVSKYFDRVKAVFYTKLLNSMLLLVDDILDPRKLLSNNVEYSDKWIILEKISQLFMSFESFKSQIHIDTADEELTKMGNDIKGESDEGDIRSKQEVKEFMQALLKQKGIGGAD